MKGNILQVFADWLCVGTLLQYLPRSFVTLPYPALPICPGTADQPEIKVWKFLRPFLSICLVPNMYFLGYPFQSPYSYSKY